MNDITELLVNKIPQYQNSIILGDFNIHIEDLNNEYTVIVNNTMRALGLEQHISGQTHVKGNSLDLIFTELSNGFDIINTTLHGFISDHCMVSVNFNINKQKFPIETKNNDPPLLKTSHLQNSIKTQPLMKPAVNLTWNCSKHSMCHTHQKHKIHQKTKTFMGQQIHQRTKESSKKS